MAQANAYNVAYPSAAAFARATRYYAPAPRKAKGCGPARSMRAALTAKGLLPSLVQGWLNVNARRAAKGLPLVWPSA